MEVSFLGSASLGDWSTGSFLLNFGVAKRSKKERETRDAFFSLAVPSLLSSWSPSFDLSNTSLLFSLLEDDRVFERSDQKQKLV